MTETIQNTLFQGVVAPTVPLPSVDTSHLFDGVTAPTIPNGGNLSVESVKSSLVQDVTVPDVPASATLESSNDIPWFYWLILAIVILVTASMVF